MYVAESGPADGTPIVFLHGAMVAGWMWTEQVQGLAEYRCLVPDLPGMGRSGDDTWVDFADAADRVAELIRERCSDGSSHLVGLSLGGVVGLNLAARHPEVLRSLLVSGVPSGTIPGPLRAMSRVLAWLYGRPSGARFVARAFGMPDEESQQAFVDTARSTDPAALRLVMDEVARAPLPAGLEDVAVPTLAVVGTKDTKPALRAAPTLQATMKDTRAYLVPDVGHPWNAEQPQLFTDMVRAWVDDGHVDERLRAAT
jgi:pimeloyl-ACP methyl ester carboxylesterase